MPESEGQVMNYPARVTLFDDGIYRWSYDMDMWHNRFMLKHVLKIVSVMCVLLFLTMLACFGPGNITPLFASLLFLIPMGALSALTLLIYLICALAMHGNYHLRFEMDENKIVLVQTAETSERNHTLASLATVAGIAAGQRNKANRVGATLRTADSVGKTAFLDITRVRLFPGDDVIDLWEWFGMNQIYVSDEDYAFVRDFILARVSDKARNRSWL